MKLVNRNLCLYMLLVLVTIGITVIFSRLLFTQDAYYRTYGDQLDIARISQIVDFQIKSEWIVYLIIPIVLVLKVLLVSLCIQIGLSIYDQNLSFGHIFNISLTAEFIFLLPQLLKIIWFLFIAKTATITEIQQFYPLSLLNLFESNEVPKYLIYPFQTLNVFEILYWLALAGGLNQTLKSDKDDGIKIVFSGYIPALFLWMLVITFLTVTFLPTTGA